MCWCCTRIVRVGYEPQLSPGTSQLCTLDGCLALCSLSDYVTWSTRVVVNCGGGFFLAALWGRLDLSSATGDATHAPCSESTES